MRGITHGQIREGLRKATDQELQRLCDTAAQQLARSQALSLAIGLEILRRTRRRPAPTHGKQLLVM